MPASDARVAANRENAQLSTGPKTPEGKERSRQNGLKHGLAGRGVVVAQEEAEEVGRRVAAFEADMRPLSPAGVVLIRKMATLSIRSERAARHEFAAIALKTRHAADDFDEARVDAASRLLDAIGEDPRGVVRKLKKSPEGVDLMLDEWADLRADLARDIRAPWTASHMERAANLSGVKIDHARQSRIGALSGGVWGDFFGLSDRDGGHLEEDARIAWSKARLFETIDAEVAALQAYRETLDFDLIEQDRIEAPDRALFDDSREANLARRYEADADRRFYKALKEFREVEVEFLLRADEARATPPPPSPEPWMVEPRAPLASRREPTMPVDRMPALAPSEADFDPSPVVRGPDGQPFSVGRPRPTPA